MNVFFISLLISSSVFSSPLQKMNQRIKVYQESEAVLCEGTESATKDDGLFLDVSCEFQCHNKPKQSERIRGAFIPKQLGLYPGKGSNNENILWSAVGVTMKTWSLKKCLEKAADGCSGLAMVETSDIKEVESGKWSIKSFPGCSEKGLTISPFNNSVASNRLNQIGSHLSENNLHGNKTDFGISLNGFKVQAPLANTKKSNSSCKKTIRAHLCFGDCIDLDAKDGAEMIETLGTQNPLGREDYEICGDDLAAKLEKLSLRPAIRKTLCETYFWDSLLKNDTNLIKSCAALRGEVNCENF